jgi:hypothetical protein
MTYAVTALTATGEVEVHSTSADMIRQALADVRAKNATNISLSQDGKTIDESQLGVAGASAAMSVGEALAGSAAARGTVERWA